MYREILEKLVEWKDEPDRKILLLAGKKGVGKTYTLKDFGDGCFENTAVIDLKKQDYIRSFLEESPNKDRFLSKLEIACAVGIKAGETLIVLENVDLLADAGMAVRFLNDEMKEFHIVLTTEIREVQFMEKLGDLAECIKMMTLYPLSFREFLGILKEDSLIEKITNSGKEPLKQEDKELLDKYFRIYLYVGGMPAVVQKYIDTKNIQTAAEEKERILEEFEKEMLLVENKSTSEKIVQMWKSIALQLDRENKKFQFGLIKLTARAREYGKALEWLYLHKYIEIVYRAKEPKVSLEENKDTKSFELFISDTGLLSSMYGLSYEDISNEEKLSLLKNGAVISQYVYQELLENENIGDIYYWVSEATAKIDFIFESGGEVIPVEINLCGNTKAQSIKVYRARYNPSMTITVSENEMNMQDGVMTLPAYAIWNL